MRVLHLTTEFPPIIFGGLGTAVGGWVNASANAGTPVAVQLVEGPLVLDGAPATYGYYGYGSLGRAAATQPASATSTADVPFFQCSWREAVDAGLRVVSEWHADVIHLHTAMLWYVAEAIQSMTGKPIVYHVHSVDRAEYEVGREPNMWLAHSTDQERAIAASDRLIALTWSEAEILASYYPETRGKVRVVGNGIDDSAEARSVAFNRQTKGPLTFLYSGRLVERKGVRELLAVAPEVLQRFVGSRLVLAGGPPPLTGGQVAAQWLGPEHRGYENRIIFTGWLSPSAVYRFYASADILVVPSRYEPFGMVVLEGMLHGLPVVAAKIGGPAEILDGGRTGVFFPPGDLAGLTTAMSLLAADGQLRARIGQAAANEVRRNWLWKHRVGRMLQVYSELVD